MKQLVLLVEDDEAVAKGLRYGLEDEGYSVIWAPAGAPGVEAVEREKPDLMVLDLRLPDMSGHDVCRSVRKKGLRLPILMLTASDDEADKLLGFEYGIDDYVVKPFSLKEVAARIHALLRRSYGELASDAVPSRIGFGGIEVDMERMVVLRDGFEVYLTPIEFRLLREFVKNPNLAMSRRSLIDAVWGPGTYLEDERTVDVHIRHLREKVEPEPSDPRWILTVRGYGYRYQRVNISK